MAYTLNSAKDARGDEGAFVQNFQKNLGAITAYKRKHGVDYETAYQGVTGQPWPSGRSVKVENGRAVMTKDRTVKSVLGKYVAPAAIAAAAPFAPAIAGALGFGGGGGGFAGLPAGFGVTTEGLIAAPAAAATAPAAPAAAGAAASSVGWLRPLLQYGVPAATGLVGQSMANRADERAAGIQNEYLDKALAEERENKTYGRTQYADYLGRLKPFQDAGSAATSRASQLLSTSRYRPETSAAGGGTVGMVALKDSQGQVRHVPAAEADRFIQAGAVRV